MISRLFSFCVRMRAGVAAHFASVSTLRPDVRRMLLGHSRTSAVRLRAVPVSERQRGQAVTEYVLLLLGVAALALTVAAWAARTGKVGELLDRVFDAITSQVA